MRGNGWIGEGPKVSISLGMLANGSGSVMDAMVDSGDLGGSLSDAIPKSEQE